MWGLLPGKQIARLAAGVALIHMHRAVHVLPRPEACGDERDKDRRAKEGRKEAEDRRRRGEGGEAPVVGAGG